MKITISFRRFYLSGGGTGSDRLGDSHDGFRAMKVTGNRNLPAFVFDQLSEDRDGFQNDLVVFRAEAQAKVSPAVGSGQEDFTRSIGHSARQGGAIELAEIAFLGK